MNEERVVASLIEILKECQVAFGHDDADSVTDATVPHGGLKGFQSDVTPTIVRRLARRMDRPLADDVAPENIFACDGSRRLTVRQAAGRFVDLYGPKGEK